MFYSQHIVQIVIYISKSDHFHWNCSKISKIYHEQHSNSQLRVRRWVYYHCCSITIFTQWNTRFVILSFLYFGDLSISRAYMLERDTEWLFVRHAGQLSPTLFVRPLYSACRLTSLSIGCLYYNCKKITYNVLLQYKIIISWSQTTFQSHVVTYKNAKQTSLKWPPFRNLDFVWRYIFCVHQPTTTKYKFMISNHFKVARGNIHKR